MQKAFPSRAAGHGPSAAICSLCLKRIQIRARARGWEGGTLGEVGAQRAVPPVGMQALSGDSQARLPKGLQLVFQV